MRTRFASRNAINENTNKSRIHDRHQYQKCELGSRLTMPLMKARISHASMIDISVKRANSVRVLKWLPVNGLP